MSENTSTPPPAFNLDKVDPALVVVMERTFTASAEQLFRAFTDQDQLIQWFGPEGWSVPAETAHINPHVGGAWKFTMVNNENPEMTSPSSAIFVTLEENKLIQGVEVMESPDGGAPTHLYMRTEILPVAGAPERTQLKITQGPLPEEYHEPGQQGWQSSFGKLERLLHS